MSTLKDEVALITGAGRGLGRATSLLLAAEGSIVLATSRTERDLESLVSEAANMGGTVIALPADVSDPLQVSHLFEYIDAQYAPIDILINSAGVGVFGDVDMLIPADYQKAVSIDLLGTIYPSREAFLRMKAQRKGHIVNVVSSAGSKARAQETAYAAAKFGVLGFTLALAEEAAPHNVHVSSFRPGGMNTSFWDEWRFHQPDHVTFMDVHEVAYWLVEILKRRHTLVVDDIALNRRKN